MALHEYLAVNRDAVIERWKNMVGGTLAPESMPPLELIDHMPRFVNEIINTLRKEAGLSAGGPSVEESSTAAGHGEHRLRLGFSLDSVVREYGALRDAIFTSARDAGVEFDSRELHVVFDCLIDGIAQAVSQYSKQRDAELSRQANEHFAFIAHELRNPLSSASIAFQRLKIADQLPPDSRAVASLWRGLQRLSELIDQTLQVARVASGIELQAQPTTLRSLFEDVAMDAIAEAESKGIELRVGLEGDERILLDARLVRSAVGNLLRNAVKYSKAGGVVELRGRIANGCVAIEIEDACGGLERGKVEQAFAPFVRFDKRQSGFGLGLAIAKQAVDAHGGSIRVQNLPGKGCIFALELPPAAPPE